MSYDPSHRMPPRQERWPQATPAEGWPPHQDGAGERTGRQGARAQQAGGSHRLQGGPQSAVATAALPVAYAPADAYGSGDAYGTDGYRTDGYVGGYTAGINGYTGAAGGYTEAGYDYPGAQGGYAESGYSNPGNQDGYGQAGNGYTEAQHGYGRAADGYGRAAGAADGFDRRPDGYPGGAYLGPGSYTETTYSGSGYPGSAYPDSGYSEPGYSDDGYSSAGYSETGYSDPGYSSDGYSEAGYFGSEHLGQTLTAPDAGFHPGEWREEQVLRRAANHRGLMVSAATEFLATAVVIGVSTLAAGLLRSPVSPVGAMGTVFIDRTPAMLRGFAMHHFGTHGRTVLLLGMYAVIAMVAITIGAAARRTAALGVTGVAAFALIAAFVAVTRPASQVADVMPAVIGGLAGVAALLWLVRASAPVQEVTPLRPARGGTRRRTR
jgi:hypothetical protein